MILTTVLDNVHCLGVFKYNVSKQTVSKTPMTMMDSIQNVTFIVTHHQKHLYLWPILIMLLY